MHDIIDLDRYVLDQPYSDAWHDLVTTCQKKLTQDGLFNLPGFFKMAAVDAAVAELQPLFAHHAFTHARRHNIYFQNTIDGLDADHPALTEFETSNRTICADQMGASSILALYEWPPFAQFLAAIMDKPQLYTMRDPLARVNVMTYSNGQALNWHFDRSEFTTTLLLQAPTAGGHFEYDRDLRSEDDPNYEGVADLLEGRRKPAQVDVSPGTLNVFKGKNTAHRVTPVDGDRDRIIAVFSFYEQPGVTFSAQERLGFYGRTQ